MVSYASKWRRYINKSFNSYMKKVNVTDTKKKKNSKVRIETHHLNLGRINFKNMP